MTENEAIKEIKYWLNVYAGSRIAPEMVQATGMAIKALEEVQQRKSRTSTRNWKATMKNTFLNVVSALCRKWLMNLQSGTDGNMEKMQLRSLTRKRDFALESLTFALYKNCSF